MKILIPIIILLALVSVAFATQIDCEEVITPNDVPCQIITSWDYTNACNTYTIRFYNSTPSLVGAWPMDDYGITGRCNTSFNFSTVDSYIFNISENMDSGRIIVEVDETMNIALAIVFSIFALLFMVGGAYLLFHKSKGDKENY